MPYAVMENEIIDSACYLSSMRQIAEIVTVHHSISHKQTYKQNDTFRYKETIHSYEAERSVRQWKEIKSTKYILTQ